MVVSVERCFSTFYDPDVGRISIHLSGKGVLTADIVNLIEEPGCKRIHITYPSVVMDVYDAICNVLKRITGEYGRTEECSFEYQDCIWDSLTQKEVSLSKENIGLLRPLQTSVTQISLLGHLDCDGVLTITQNSPNGTQSLSVGDPYKVN